MGRGLINIGHIELDDEFTFSRFFGSEVYSLGSGHSSELCCLPNPLNSTVLHLYIRI